MMRLEVAGSGLACAAVPFAFFLTMWIRILQRAIRIRIEDDPKQECRATFSSDLKMRVPEDGLKM